MTEKRWTRIRTTCLLAALAMAALPLTAAGPGDDLAALDDEFENAASAGDWQRIYLVEEWGVDHLEVFDVDTTQAGQMVMIPHSSTWFRDFRSTLAFKEVTGDFVISTEVHVNDRDSQDSDRIPLSLFSLAGLMVRAPSGITRDTWQPGGENYVFLSLGNGNQTDQPTQFQFEVKTTENSVSVLELDEVDTPHALIQIARIGDAVITLRKLPGANWRVHRRFQRTDLPDTLQAGFVAYTDWRTVSSFQSDPFVANSSILDGNPDLAAGFEYARFTRPDVPAELAGLDLTRPSMVSDEDLLSFLGEIPATRALVRRVRDAIGGLNRP